MGVPDTPPPVVLPALSVADARADEGGTLEFQVTLNEAATAEVTVDYATSDGTATAGADYTAASGTLTFAAGETAKTVSVALLHDGSAESDETVTLTLTNAFGRHRRRRGGDRDGGGRGAAHGVVPRPAGRA